MLLNPSIHAHLAKRLEASVLPAGNRLPKDVQANWANQVLHIHLRLIEQALWDPAVLQQVCRVRDRLLKHKFYNFNHSNSDLNKSEYPVSFFSN